MKQDDSINLAVSLYEWALQDDFSRLHTSTGDLEMEVIITLYDRVAAIVAGHP